MNRNIGAESQIISFVKAFLHARLALAFKVDKDLRNRGAADFRNLCFSGSSRDVNSFEKGRASHKPSDKWDKLQVVARNPCANHLHFGEVGALRK